MFLAYVINKHPLSLSGLLWSGHIMCNPPSCQAPRDLTSASLPSSLPMFALLTWGQHSPLLLLLWRHRTCYYLKTFALHQWLSPQIFAWFVTSCHSRLTSPERYLIYWSPHLKWPTPPALLLLHLVLFPLFYITVWNHSLFIYVFTAYLLPLECKFHEDRTRLPSLLLCPELPEQSLVSKHMLNQGMKAQLQFDQKWVEEKWWKWGLFRHTDHSFLKMMALLRVNLHTTQFTSLKSIVAFSIFIDLCFHCHYQP